MAKTHPCADNIKVTDVREVSPKIFEIVYSINKPKVKGPIHFSAHVGIEDEGFIPIEATISKSKQ